MKGLVVRRGALTFFISSQELGAREEANLLASVTLGSEICRLRLDNDRLREENRKLRTEAAIAGWASVLLALLLGFVATAIWRSPW